MPVQEFRLSSPGHTLVGRRSRTPKRDVSLQVTLGPAIESMAAAIAARPNLELTLEEFDALDALIAAIAAVCGDDLLAYG